ncbi:unnamed protein product [Mytilus coruscus]|uniref:Uncharacterized protein n=1 Tax=Mytilus coruscus TaxID=42192 RepID=A0A6J8ERH2_MYTCO|nr:unnamed protein product [Mytilus coruscus]
MPPVPRPYPDYEQLPQFHYLQHKDTPISIDGVQRRHDDFQPRSNLKKLFSEGEISSVDDNEIETERKEQLIIKKRQDEGAKGYEYYDWVDMFENNCIDKLTVSILDKYIIHKQLGYFKYKHEMVQAVKRAIASNLVVEEEELADDENDDVVIEQY